MDSTPELNKALAACQGKFPAVEKGRTATVRTKSGGSYSYDYADLSDLLSAVRPVLSAHGLAISHDQETTRDPLGVATVAILEHASGERKTGKVIWLPCSQDMQPVQAIGSAMTYGRRYTTQAILGIATETDDDGNTASGNDAATKPKADKKPDPPKDAKPAKAATVSEGLRKVLIELGCKEPAQSDAVIRYATHGQLCLSDCRGSDGNSETARVDIEATLGGLMAATDPPTQRSDAVHILFADALQAVEKGAR